MNTDLYYTADGAIDNPRREWLSPKFAVFNLHVNKAGERADAEFTSQLGQESFDKHIKPCHDAGIMSIFQGARTPERAVWVALCTLFVNGEQEEA